MTAVLPWAGTANVTFRTFGIGIDVDHLELFASLATASFFVAVRVSASAWTAWTSRAILDFASLRQSISVGNGTRDLAVILISLIGQHARKVKKHRICCSDLRRVLGTRVVRCYKERE